MVSLICFHYFIVGTLPAFLCGALFTWTSPSIPILMSEDHHYHFTLEECSYLTVLPPITQILSSFLYARVMDIFGRKYTLLSVAIPHILALVLIALAENIYVFYLSRALTGLADCCMFTILPTYIGEISTPKVRGTWGNAVIFMLYSGELMMNVSGGYTDIKTNACIWLSVPLLFLATFVFVPESPYYCIMKGNKEAARKSLRQLRRTENVDDEILKLEADVTRQMSESGTWKDLWTIKSNRKALFAGIFLRGAQQFCGISAFCVYTQYIFQQAQGNMSATESSIIFIGSIWAMNFVASCVLDRFSRRSAMMFSLLGSAIVLGAQSAYFYVSLETGIDVSDFGWVPLVGMLLYVIVYSFGLGILPTSMLGELFSASIKGKGHCILNIFFGIGVSVFTKLFQLLEVNFGLFSPFAFYSVCCFLNTFVAYFLIPETSGKTLEEIQQSLKGNIK